MGTHNQPIQKREVVKLVQQRLPLPLPRDRPIHRGGGGGGGAVAASPPLPPNPNFATTESATREKEEEEEGKSGGKLAEQNPPPSLRALKEEARFSPFRKSICSLPLSPQASKQATRPTRDGKTHERGRRERAIYSTEALLNNTVKLVWSGQGMLSRVTWQKMMLGFLN